MSQRCSSNTCSAVTNRHGLDQGTGSWSVRAARCGGSGVPAALERGSGSSELTTNSERASQHCNILQTWNFSPSSAGSKNSRNQARISEKLCCHRSRSLPAPEPGPARVAPPAPRAAPTRTAQQTTPGQPGCQLPRAAMQKGAFFNSVWNNLINWLGRQHLATSSEIF